jgi:hypothetical protein
MDRTDIKQAVEINTNTNTVLSLINVEMPPRT